jgi:hypothetical protein
MYKPGLRRDQETEAQVVMDIVNFNETTASAKVNRDLIKDPLKYAYAEALDNCVVWLRAEEEMSTNQSVSEVYELYKKFAIELLKLQYKRDGYKDRTTGKPKVEQHRSSTDIVLETRKEAEHILTKLEELIENYDIATVADLYQFVGLNEQEFDNYYGWRNLSEANIVRISAGYSLNLPNAVLLS